MTKEEFAYEFVTQSVMAEAYKKGIEIGAKEAVKRFNKGMLIGTVIAVGGLVMYKQFKNGWNVAKEEMEDLNNEI